jgi:hypothetical protein
MDGSDVDVAASICVNVYFSRRCTSSVCIETRFRLYGYFGIMSDISTPVNGKHVGQSCDSGECLWLNLVAYILFNLISYLIPRRLSRPLKKRSGRGLHGHCRDAEDFVQCPASLLQSLQRYLRTRWHVMRICRQSLHRIRGRDMIDTCIVIRTALRIRFAINPERHSMLYHLVPRVFATCKLHA